MTRFFFTTVNSSNFCAFDTALWSSRVLKTPWDTFPIAHILVRAAQEAREKVHTKDHPGDCQIYIDPEDFENRSLLFSPSSGRCRYASSVKLNNIYATRVQAAFRFFPIPAGGSWGSFITLLFFLRRREELAGLRCGFKRDFSNGGCNGWRIYSRD